MNVFKLRGLDPSKGLELDTNPHLTRAVRRALLGGALGLGPVLSAGAGVPDFQDPGLGLTAPPSQVKGLTLVDLDADQDFDLLVDTKNQDSEAGQVFGYLNMGTPHFPMFGPPEPYREIPEFEISHGYADLDGDGDLDLMTFDSTLDAVRYFENLTSSASPVYAPPLSDPFGLDARAEHPVARYPDGDLEFADIDDDGDLDLFYLADDLHSYPKFSRVIQFYENQGSAHVPQFFQRSATDLGFPYHLAPSAADELRFGDLDGDGDLDAVDSCASWLENIGTPSEPQFLAQGLDSGGGCARDLADLDADGDADGMGHAGQLFYLLETLRQGDGFTTQPSAPILIAYDVPNWLYADLGDLDGDGDLDLLTGTGSQFVWHENLGTPYWAEFDPVGQPGPFGLDRLAATSPDEYLTQLIDMDADQDLDLVTATGDRLSVVENTGSPSAPWFAPEKTVMGEGGELRKLLGDVTGDQAPDLFNLGRRELPYQPVWDWTPNIGTPQDPEFETWVLFPEQPPWGVFEWELDLVEGDWEGELACGPEAFGCELADLSDLDLDGDLDIATTGGDWFRNNGYGSHPWFELQPLHNVGGGLYGDLDGDGDQDLLKQGQGFWNQVVTADGARSISSQGYAAPGIMLAFTIEGPSPQTVIIQGLGPSIADSGGEPRVDNPSISLYSEQGLIAENDDWGDRPEQSLIAAAGLAPGDPREAALMARLSPGTYVVYLDGSAETLQVGQILVTEAPYDYGYSRLTPLAQPVGVFNLSTRSKVTSGSSMHGGFVIRGGAKALVVRGLGPTLADLGLAGVLADPQLTLYRQGEPIADSDDWKSAGGCGGSGQEPNYDTEPCVFTLLEPGVYSAVLHGVGGAEGKAIISMFDLGGSGRIVNLSTRSRVVPSEENLTGGFVIRGKAQTLLIKGLGPTLTERGVADAIADPVITLYSGQTPIAYNDDAPDSSCAGADLAPAYESEACIRIRLAPGAYTAIVKNADGTAGDAIVSVNLVGE